MLEKKFTWTPTDEANFAELKSLVASAPLLCILDYSRDIYIRCDSSRYGAGAVLFQYDGDGREMPVCYASRKYTMAERNYCTFQQEAAAVAQTMRLNALGLDARVKKEALLGKTLFLVQSGPYSSRDQLSQLERILRSNGIDSMRIGVSQ